MSRNDDPTRAREIVIERQFAAPRALVFREWLAAESLREWFAPDTYVTTASAVDPRPGGKWRLDFRSESGHTYVEHGEFHEIDEPNRLVFTLTQVDGGKSYAETLVTVTFTERAGGTHMHFLQAGFESAERRDGNAEGWLGCFEKLSRLLSNERSEREIRELFATWFALSSARDIEGTMAPIAKHVVSYEHIVPLQYDGVDAVRAVCQQGFDLAKGELSWTIPDLQVIVRDDIAVTWGLNCMEFQEPGQPKQTSFSRGTRIFQRIDGRWQMIHQHVSYPFDHKTGRAVADLRPE
jgi:uncharacterized protein YndB with AHSA1/START domain/ketosteroid isomerase-like protein